MKKLSLLVISIVFVCLSLNAQWTGADPLTTPSKVGIGDPNPAKNLVIRSEQSPVIRLNFLQGDIYGLNNNLWDIENNLGLSFRYGIGSETTTKVFFSTDGNVGIGTIFPKAKLDVNGNIQISTATLPMGLITELGGTTPLLNMSVNFHENKIPSYLGAAFRIDARSSTTIPLFQWLSRDAGTTIDNTIMSLTPNSTWGMGTTLEIKGSANPCIKLSTTSNGTTYFGKATNAGAWASYAVAGDFVIKSGGSSHNIYLHLNNNSNNGASVIGIGDEANGRTFNVFNNGKVTIGNTNPGLDGKLAISGNILSDNNGRTYFVNKAIPGQSEDGAGVNYILLHEIYTSTPIDDRFVMGKITGIRGGTSLGNRKLTVEVNTASAYESNRGSLISYNEGIRIVTLTNNADGKNYVALEIPTGSTMYSFSFTGYAYNASLTLVNSNVSNVAAFTSLDPINIIASNTYFEGKIRSKEVKVESNVLWPDYVFTPSHKLRTLGEVEQFIKANGHLPEIPKAEDVDKEGINLGEMQTKLLQKVEELTLYMIEMKKENEQLKKEIEELKKK
jgi:hypothetical protein